MKKYKYLFQNIGLLTISRFGTSILSFLLVPIYTNILSTEEYGTYDLFNTTISLLIPILSLNIMQSVMRFSLENDKDEKEVFSIGFDIFIKGFLFFLFATYFVARLKIFPVLNDYMLYFILLYFFSALQQLLVYYARGKDDIRVVSSNGVITALLMFLLNIFFLVYIELGLSGYFLSYIFSLAFSCIHLLIQTKAYNSIRLNVSNTELRREMLQYSFPLIFNSVAWWINNASDRYVVIFFCGVAINGVYSIAYKIPNILNIFQNIFNQAWTLSAVKEFDSEDENGFFSSLYNKYNCFITIICSLLIIFDRLIAKLLYAKEFYEAWVYVPFLLIAIVFGALSGYAGGIFSAVKDSKEFARSTIVGAIINIVLNIILTNYYGALGAAISTAISFYVVWIIRIIHIKKLIRMKLFLIRDHITYVLLIFQSLALLLIRDNVFFLYSMLGISLIGILVLYKNEILYSLLGIEEILKR